ncbi:IS5 family transposase [Nonomuraea sp. NPDC050383]|uniref:IS5 family transposase n=1 Tax=Nonomuraea sp. NPDC050383 TaxID=3364362 RepID=UPI00378E7EB9
MVRRHELTDAAWERIAPLLPAMWKIRTGADWRDMPERYGPWQTIYQRFRRWSAEGTWQRLLEHVQAHDDAAGAVDWSAVCVDSTIVRAHQLGRSRGGLTTKLHLATDGRGLPLAFVVTGGNINDCTPFTQVMAALRIPRLGRGRPRTRPEHVIADKGYSSRAIRTYLRRRGIGATIPERADQLAGRAHRGHRRCAFDPARYKRRNVIERCFNRLKQARGIATRYDKLAVHYQAGATIICLLLWLT